MSEAIPFAKEVIAQVRTSDRWFNHGMREVRAFVKGPHRGIDENTGICLLLHGQGGRQNDISWKMLRRSLSEKHNMLVVGLNYLGTDLSERSNDFIGEQARMIYLGLRANPELAAKMEAGESLVLSEQDYWFFENQRAALIAGLPYPSEFWDWGLLQALDAINVLSWVLDETKLQPKRVAMVSRSAGAQIAYTLLKLLPQTFSGYLDLGGAAYGASNRDWLEKLLEDPFGHVSPSDKAGIHFGNESPRFGFFVRKRWPHPSLGREVSTGASLADEVDIRDVIKAEHLSDASSLSLLRVEQGAEDEHFAPSQKEELLAPFRERGVDAGCRAITEADCDGVLRDNAGHTFMKDYNKLVLEEHDEVFQTERRGDAPVDLLSGTKRAFPCSTGSFELGLGPCAEMRFVKGG